jgi:hypothetical protein
MDDTRPSINPPDQIHTDTRPQSDVLQQAISIATSPVMPTQASHFLRLPVELRLIIYEYIFDDPKGAVIHHSLTYVSDQISEEVMPILLPQFSFFFWTAIACNEEWYLALQPRNKIWRMRLTNVSELPLETVPRLHTKTSFHLLVGRRLTTTGYLSERLYKNRVYGRLSSMCGLVMEKHDQQDGVKRLSRDVVYRWNELGDANIWLERGRAGAPEMNKKLTERVWHQQWLGGYRRGPAAAWMCKLEVDLEDEAQHAS